MFLKQMVDEQLIERSEHWVLIKQISENKQSAIIYKMVESTHQESVSNLYYELEMIKLLQSKYTLQPIRIEQQEMNLLLAFTYEDNLSFNKYLTKPLPVLTFLTIALKMSNIFIDIHNSSVVYRNIHRNNFLINEKTFEIKLINFEHAYKFHRETLFKIEEQHRFMYRSSYFAPEETGRLNDSIDYRTDLYSLGVLFYEMVTGILPFYNEDPQQLFNKIITSELVPVKKLNQKVPQPVANIIEKLLCKNKAERYQSATGLKEDLLYCWNKFVNSEPLTEFELGANDEPMFTGLSSKIPSREEMVQSIISRYGQNGGQRNISVFIEGDAGSGKTELVKMLKNEWTQQNAIILEAKIDSTMQNVQLAPIVISIRNQLKQIYMQGTVSVEKMKDLFEKENIIFYEEIFRLIPELQWFVSEQLLKSPISVQQYTNDINTLFYRAIQQIMAVLMKNNEFFVIMIDNAHLLDSDSLQCLEMIHKELKPIHFIFTYKEMNEVIRELQHFRQDYEDVHLHNLTIEEVNAWLEHSLKEKSNNIRRLASLLYDLTKGNPLFIQELFQKFMQMNLFYYNLRAKCWSIDLQKITDMKMSENLIGFFASRLEDLTDSQEEILKVASCIGTTFNVGFLEIFLQIPRNKMMDGLHSLIQAGCIIPLNERLLAASSFDHVHMFSDMELDYRFVHTEIQKVIYNQIPSSELLRIHYRLANILEGDLCETVSDDELLKIIHHFNLCRVLLKKEEKIKLAKWNLLIGKNTTFSGLFQNANHFLSIASELVEGLSWEEDEREFLLELCRITGVSKYMSGFNDEAEAYFDKGLAYAKTNKEKLVLYNEKILFYSSLSSDEQITHNTRKALATAVEALRLVNIDLKENISTAAILKEYSLLNFALRKKPIKQLIDLKKNENETIDLILKVLLNVVGSALVIDEKLFTWITFRSLRLILKHGDVEFASLIFSNFSIILMSGFHNTKRSYQFGLLSIKHVERENKIWYKMNVYMNYGINIGLWSQPYMNSNYYLSLGLENCLNSKLHGLFAALSVSYMHLLSLAQNKPLPELLQEIEDHQKYINRTKNVSPIELVHELKEWVQALKSHTKQINWNLPISNTTEVSNWENHLALRIQMSYLFHEEKVASDLIEKIDEQLKLKITTVSRPQWTFYSALWMVHLLQRTSVSKKTEQKYVKHIKTTIKQFRGYVQYAPVNFEHLYYLLKAEYSLYLKKMKAAELYYDRAIQLASLNGFLSDKAVANRCAALFYEERNERYRAGEYMQQAIEQIYEWGASRLATHWEQKYEYLLMNKSITRKTSVLVPFDMNAVIEINQLLSRETKMDELIQKVLQLMMKHADANRSYFFKKENGSMQFIAKAALENHTFTVAHDYDGKKESLSLQSIMQYVLKSEQHVIIDNTDLPSPFLLDLGEKSILCLPIFYQGHMTAILYLANTMTPYVFTNDKIELLKMISSQVAISIEHTKIYEHLEEQVTERTDKLHQANYHLNEMNERLQQNEAERKLLLQNVSHDLRSPITSVLGYVDAILDGIVVDPEMQKVHLERSRGRLISLNYLIQDLFDLSQLEAGRTKFHFKTWSVEELFVTFDSKFRLDVEQADLTYSSSYSVEGEHEVVLDIDRIEQVLTNLITNAIKYTTDGKIHFSMLLEGNKWICSVKDSGIGIPEKELPFIYDMHYRASNNKSGNSNGIGLAICKQIMVNHQGEIFVDSIEDVGSVFSIMLAVD